MLSDAEKKVLDVHIKSLVDETESAEDALQYIDDICADVEGELLRKFLDLEEVKAYITEKING